MRFAVGKVCPVLESYWPPNGGGSVKYLVVGSTSLTKLIRSKYQQLWTISCPDADYFVGSGFPNRNIYLAATAAARTFHSHPHV